MDPMNVDQYIDDLARAEHTSKEGILKEAVRALLREKKRAIQSDQLDLLRRYGVASPNALEERIRQGQIEESPAWEDRVALDNLTSELKQIEHDLAAL